MYQLPYCVLYLLEIATPLLALIVTLFYGGKQKNGLTKKVCTSTDNPLTVSKDRPMCKFSVPHDCIFHLLVIIPFYKIKFIFSRILTMLCSYFRAPLEAPTFFPPFQSSFLFYFCHSYVPLCWIEPAVYTMCLFNFSFPSLPLIF